MKIYTAWSNGSSIELLSSWNAVFLGERSIYFYPDGGDVKMDLALSLDFPSGNMLTGTIRGERGSLAELLGAAAEKN